MNTVQREIKDKVVTSFIEVGGLVWGIEMGRRGWSDADMKLFNNKLVDIRDNLIAFIDTTQNKARAIL